MCFNNINYNFRLAEEKKESGNHLYKFKNYKGALAMYDEAIKLCPDNAAFYGNRSACYMMLGMYRKAMEDAQKAVALDSTFTKGFIRIAKCAIALGNYRFFEFHFEIHTFLDFKILFNFTDISQIYS